ncbi:SH3 and cysteine-rich domain-containing protein 2-like [Denticeps clupeoides]|uniref:SH3 and cysteine-rich domain-containing protein 2 n=1 Tax=Denticeps clupeoides TaxID=299321 RepID=A0AAY4CYA2_9TELE|nr:SH3 and cysteine-rich domain-containing protein 2-like [Denticeps clupeoides]
MTENSEVEGEPQPTCDLQRSPSTMSITPVSKLQRLKRSLSFMRSKSVENFFQRSCSDARLPPDFLSDPPPPSPPLLPGSLLPTDTSPIPSPSVSPNPSINSHSPSLSPSPSLPAPRPPLIHCFLEHVFRRPTSCQLCKNIIVGNSKQGLRCKTCKMGAHLWCSSELSQQPCQGKSGMFKRNFSSPLLGSDPLGVVKEVQATQESRARVDPVYATLRFGTSLAQMSRSSFGSVCESPTRSLGEGAEEREEGQTAAEVAEATEAAEEDSVQEMEKDTLPSENENTQVEEPAKVPKRIEVHSVHTYVALYKFLPQEQNDLELHPGDRVQVTDDSNEEWWKGKCGDKVGFFPANFVQRVRPGERVWRVTQNLPGDREMGHMTVKESQICVGKNEDTEGFLKLSSGKKRGLVPTNSLEEI